MTTKLYAGLGLIAVALLATTGCGGSGGGTDESGGTTIVIEGSDTMVNLAQAWAEKYHAKHSHVSPQVTGGGSGIGIAGLINGTCDMANCSRQMKTKEVKAVEAERGQKAIEHIVGYDALAVYVHKDNPVDSISIEELAEIYGEGGKTVNWSAVGGEDLEIQLLSRQNNSGTYAYFREAVLGKDREYKLGTRDLSGSKDVVALVAETPGAIGYSGMGYATPEVKMLKISKTKGEEGVAPTLKNAQDGSYPITRPLYIYTAGELTGAAKQYLDWIMSPEGQMTVEELGYVPIGSTEAVQEEGGTEEAETGGADETVAPAKEND